MVVDEGLPAFFEPPSSDRLAPFFIRVLYQKIKTTIMKHASLIGYVYMILLLLSLT